MFVRHVRRVTLTPEAATLYPLLCDGFDAFDRAFKRIHAGGSRATVVLSATRLFTARLLVPALGSFAQAHPEIDLHLHASDLVADLVAGDADIAVRYGDGPFGDLVAEPLLAERVGVLCSPTLGLTSTGDLRRVPLLHSQWTSTTAAPDWAAWARLAGIPDLQVSTGPRFTDDGHALQAAIAGHGAVVSSLTLAAPDIAAGLLIHPFGPVIEGKGYYFLATASASARPEVVVARDWLRAIANAENLG